MPKIAKPLTDTACRQAKFKGRPLYLFDGGGLHLAITEKAKYWRFKYRINGKGCLLGFGKYPDISLLEARQLRDKARQDIANGQVPEGKKKKRANEAIEDTFSSLSACWLESRRDTLSKSRLYCIQRVLNIDIIPAFGQWRAAAIKSKDVLEFLQRLEQRGAPTVAREARGIMDGVFRLAIAKNFIEYSPAASLADQLKSRKKGHFAAVTTPREFGQLLKALDSYQGFPTVQTALRILPLVCVRRHELLNAKWCEFDFDMKLWRIPADRMKTRQEHIVPLSEQVIQLLQELKPITGHHEYIFSGVHNTKKPLAGATLLNALRAIGVDKNTATIHGFRATFRTLADEVLNERIDIIEACLAHKVSDPLGRSYNRTNHLDARRELVQRWSDYCENLKLTE